MNEKEDNEKLIGKLIKKRKEENEAFMKLLNAMDIKAQQDSAKHAPLNKEKTLNHKSIL